MKPARAQVACVPGSKFFFLSNYMYYPFSSLSRSPLSLSFLSLPSYNFNVEVRRKLVQIGSLFILYAHWGSIAYVKYGDTHFYSLCHLKSPHPQYNFLITLPIFGLLFYLFQVLVTELEYFLYKISSPLLNYILFLTTLRYGLTMQPWLNINFCPLASSSQGVGTDYRLHLQYCSFSPTCK